MTQEEAGAVRQREGGGNGSFSIIWNQFDGARSGRGYAMHANGPIIK